jgi:hypothetical protein
VIACLGQLYSRAADEALLVALLIDCLLELLFVFIVLALMVLGTLVKQGPALDASQLPASFSLADGVCDLGLWILGLRSGM